MPATTLRASYTISTPTLLRFNAIIPQRERSRMVEAYMQKILADKERELAKLADIYMADPAFAQCREDEKAWEVTLADGLENY
jgi:hypothetical protein